MKSILAVLLSVTAVAGFGSYRDIIPNGRSVPNPCNGGVWQAVGHPDPSRGGQRNSFANDFDTAGRQWNVQVCQADSDGDGVTNGEELGDPNCTWRIGQQPLMAATGHPGICEPIDTPTCIQVNTFLNSGNCQRLSQQGGNVNPTTPDQCISPCVCLPQSNPTNTGNSDSMESGESGESAESGPDSSEEFGRRKRDTNWWRQRRQQRRRQQSQNQNAANRQSLASNTCDCVCPL